MKYDEYFQSFCKIIFKYQFLKNQTEITAAITEWLYEHSAGVVSVVVSLIHDAQEIAILTGKEVLNLDTLNEAYQQRLTLRIFNSSSFAAFSTRVDFPDPVLPIIQNNLCILYSSTVISSKITGIRSFSSIRSGTDTSRICGCASSAVRSRK